VGAALFYVAMGAMVIPLVGPQQDECLFVRGILPPVYVHSASHRYPDVAFMLMPYIGALKIWLYKPLFAIWGSSLWTLRFPVVILGGFSVWLAFAAARRFITPWWAAAGAWLLAADPIFIWTGTLDWGPVALQHLLALSMVCCAIRVHQSGDWRWALGAGLAAGLGVWDKASFLWILAALVLAYVADNLRAAVSAWVRPRVAAAAAMGFLAGAAIFIRFNLRHGMETFRAQAGLEWNLPNKLLGLVVTLNGSSLFGFIVNDSGGPGLIGWSLLPLALVASVLIGLALEPVRRTTQFLSISFAAGYLLMALMKNAGFSSHHIVLLWPLPHLIVAAAAAGLWQGQRAARILALALPALVLGSGLLVHARYVRQARIEGAAVQWTLASRQLAARLEALNPPAIFVVDWGILDPLRVLGGGRLPLLPASDTIAAEIELSLADPRLLKLKDPSTLVVTRPDKELLFPNLNSNLNEWAAANGLSPETIERIQDDHGVTRFEIRRFAAPRQ